MKRKSTPRSPRSRTGARSRLASGPAPSGSARTRAFPLETEPSSSALHLANVELTLVGAGRSGAHVALVLAQLGVPLRIYDPDRLGPENQGRQIYRRADVAARREKVRALRALLRAIVPGAPIRVRAERFDARPGQPCSPIVVLAVDTMAERRRLWERLSQAAAGTMLLVDVRLGPALLRVHEVRLDRPDDVADYEASLHDDPEHEVPACAEEATAHAAAAAAALVAGALRALVHDLPRPRWTALDLDRGQWYSGPCGSQG